MTVPRPFRPGPGHHQPGQSQSVEPQLRITVKHWEPSITVLEVAGEIDSVTAATMGEQIQDQFDPRRVLLVDLSEVTFLCSAGLSVLLDSRAKAHVSGVDLRLIATARPVQRLIALTGLEEPLPTYPTLLAALPLQR